MSIMRSTMLRSLAAAALLAVVGVVALQLVDEYTSNQIGTFGAYACAALGLTLLVGGNGQVSLGHAALMAVGAYTVAKFLPSHTDAFGQTTILVTVLALAIAVVMTTLVGIVVGLAAARLRGPYLAGATLAMGVAVTGVTTYFHDFFNGEQGLSIPVPVVPGFLADLGWGISKFVAFVAVMSAVVVVWALANLKSSSVGRHYGAVRDNEIAAQLCGLSVPRVQISAFAVSAATAGLGGACLGMVAQTANPHAYGLVLSLVILSAVVIGGLGSLRGALIGALLVVFLNKFLDDIDLNPNAPDAAFGLLLLIVMLAAPGGVYGILARLGSKLPGRVTPQLQGGK